MPRGRMINKKIVDDERLNDVPIEAELLFFKMITHLDREGRLKANPRLVRNTFFSLRDYSVEDVEGWLEDLASQKKGGVGLIELYQVEGRQYLWMPGFEGEQGRSWQTSVKPREAASDLPPPPGFKPAPKAEEKGPTSKAADIIDEKLAAVVRCYEDNIGIGTPAIFERLKVIVDTYPEGWFEKAVEEACRHQKQSLAYIEKILERWGKEGFASGKSEKEGPDKYKKQKYGGLMQR